MRQRSSIAIHDLYPEATPEQSAEAEMAFRRYIETMVRIYERVRAEQGPETAKRLAYGDLIVSQESANVLDERSNPSINPPEIV
jgi:hypothetical protein